MTPKKITPKPLALERNIANLFHARQESCLDFTFRMGNPPVDKFMPTASLEGYYNDWLTKLLPQGVA